MTFNICDGELLQYNGKSKDVIIPDNVTKISAIAFRGNKSINTIHIPDGCEFISGGAFKGCSKLSAIHIPKSLKAIDLGAFQDCSNLKEVYIDDLAAWCDIWFVDADSNPLRSGTEFLLDGKRIVDLIIPEGVKEIGNRAFAKAEIESVVIPEGVEVIGENAFNDCKKITNIKLPSSIKKICNYAFLGCSNLKEIHIADLAAWCGIKVGFSGNPSQYGADLLLDGKRIVDLVIPDGVKKIGEMAFANTKIESVVIPEGVEEIGIEAFSNCKKITSINLPNSIRIIGHGAFRDCSNLSDVNIPDSIREIGDWAFGRCRLEKIFIPDTVKTMGEYAFAGIKELTVYESLRGMIMKICVPGLFEDTEVKYEVTILSNGTDEVKSKILFLFRDMDSTYELFKASCHKKKASFDFDYFDKNFKKIKSAKIKEEIAKYRLKNPFGLSKESEKKYRSFLKKHEDNNSVEQNAGFDIEKGTLLKYIGSGKSTVVIPEGIRSIGESAFSDYNEEIEEIIIPEGVTTVEKDIFGSTHAFCGCCNLKKIHVPDSLINAPHDTFDGYRESADLSYYNLIDRTNLGSEIDDGLYLGNDKNPYACFVRVVNKEAHTVAVHEGCKLILGEAFQHCNNLKNIILPSTLVMIGEGSRKEGKDKTINVFSNPSVRINMPENYFKTTEKLPGKVTNTLLTKKWKNSLTQNDLAWLYLFQSGKVMEDICDEVFRTDRNKAVQEMLKVCQEKPVKRAVVKLAKYVLDNVNSINSCYIEGILQLASSNKIKAKEINQLSESLKSNNE